MKKLSDKDHWEKIEKAKKRYQDQKKFPALPNPYEDRLEPIKYTGHLIFIRSKFIYLALIECIKEKNLYAAYSLLKSYWEEVAAFGYYYITVSQLLESGDKEGAFEVSKKMGLGGRGFLTEEMVKKKGQTLKDFKIPSIYTMMDKVDKDWKKISGKKDKIMRNLYHKHVAEAGHTTFLGLSIGAEKLEDGSSLPDVNKSWEKSEETSILNLTAMSSLIFFYYWDKFQKLDNS